MAEAEASDDGDLVAAWQAGDQSAGQQLVRSLFPRVVRFLRGKVPDAEVKDLAQQTFVELSRGLAKIDAERPVAPLVFTIARRQLLHFYRYQRRHPVDPLVSTAQDLAATPSKVVHGNEVVSALRAGLRQLPLDAQMCLELRYWERLGIREIADVLELSPSAVKMRLLRARNMLRDRLEGAGLSAALAATTLANFEDGSADPE